MRRFTRVAASGKDARSLERTIRERRPWFAAGALVIAIGTVGALYGANAVATSSAQGARRAQSVAAAGIAANLQLVLQHEHDLVVSASAFFLNSAHPNEESFLQWAGDVGALARYPELLGIGEAVIVPASELAAFEAAASATKTGVGSSPTTFSVIPAGK